ncbi:RagB/SusD family nutrient uptake outer membrane protein [Riemerella columbina]|uniref:RagB/SusD family nutrient uptake outer membrane protein n=1 Tax=Riemerella columbina TaxID=103810 RepID=UPI002670BEF5|nr:RagB/SusD family nutrient uptake outer membrane protein [Riemerella columbina]WKS95116.1 RagB/SusD family nutrient uptake outer membrane protein [Riemerella columbina]
MNKNIIKIALLAIPLSLISVSCDRELDQNSYSKVNDEVAFQDPSNFTGALLSSYAQGRLNYSGDTGNLLGITDIFTDNLILSPDGRYSNSSTYVWNITPTNAGVTGVYTNAYLSVNRANTVLKYLNNLPTGEFRTNVEAEARALRALWHFDIVRSYCKIPTQSSDANASLGIAYLTEFAPETYTTRDLNVSQVYEKIVSDLEFAAEHLTIKSPDKNRFTKEAVLGLLSRVYLYMGEYDKAIEAGKKSLAIVDDPGSLNSFNKIFTEDDATGVLLKFSNSLLDNIGVGTVFQQDFGKKGIKAEYAVEKDLYDMYSNDDVRKSTYIKTTVYNNNSYNVVVKYQNAGQNRPDNVVDVKYLRTAEVYLNVAEAAYRKGDAQLALEMLNALRTNRYQNYTIGNESGNDLLDAILKERRLELAFEADRFYTLKRLGLSVQRSGKGPYADGSGNPNSKQNLPASSNYWQWPIPQSEININKDLKQNPGY